MRRKAGSVAVVAALVVLAGVVVPGAVGGAPAAPVGGVGPSAAAPPVVAQPDDGNATNATNGTGDVPLGVQVSSFMAASSADAENEVETGMFTAQWNRSNASQRERLVDQRTDEIAERVAELRRERQELLASENLTARERARATWLATQANGLARSVGLMTEAADRANVSVDRRALGELRRNARNLSGGEISEMAGGGVDRGPPDDVGPPAGAGPPGEERERGNGTDAGPPDDRNERGNGTDAGPPDDPGGGDGGAGAGGGGGSGNDGPPGQDDDDDSGNGGGSGNGNGSGGSGNPGGGNDDGDDPGRGNGDDGNGDGNGNGDDGNGGGNGNGGSGNGSGNGKGN